MQRSQRGAARVSAVWMIAVIVAFFVALAVAFVAFDEGGTIREQHEAAQANLKAAEERLDAERAHLRAISEVVGFYDEAQASPRSEIEAIREGFTTFRDAFPEMDPSIKTLQKALPVAVASYNSKLASVRDLEGQLAQRKTELDAREATLRELTQGKDRDMAQLRSELSDLEQARSEMQTTLERQVASLRADLASRDTDYRTAQSEIDEAEREFARKEQTYRARFDEMSRKLEFEREPEAPDGQILAVSPGLALGWINLGAHNRLARGTSFRVVSGEAGSRRVKAWAEVETVQPDKAEVRFYGQADPFDPPVEGDVVYNPLYDPVGERNAVLVGRFSGTFNEKELRELLAKIGIRVQPALDLTTDYLIVGQELYLDPETLEPLEEPLQPSDLPIYKDAVANGVAIVPIKDVRTYFKN